MILPVLLLAAVTLERVGELWLARSNTTRLLDDGAKEVAPGHYPLIVLLHGSWLGGLWLLASSALLHGWWVVAFGLVLILRLWTLSTLGRRWTTRIIVKPRETLVAKGPYRFVRHPNYIIVIAEIALLPLCFGMPFYALLFSIANAVILTIRIKAENAALTGLSRDGTR